MVAVAKRDYEKIHRDLSIALKYLGTETDFFHLVEKQLYEISEELEKFEVVDKVEDDEQKAALLKQIIIKDLKKRDKFIIQEFRYMSALEHKIVDVIEVLDQKLLELYNTKIISQQQYYNLLNSLRPLATSVEDVKTFFSRKGSFIRLLKRAKKREEFAAIMVQFSDFAKNTLNPIITLLRALRNHIDELDRHHIEYWKKTRWVSVFKIVEASKYVFNKVNSELKQLKKGIKKNKGRGIKRYNQFNKDARKLVLRLPEGFEERFSEKVEELKYEERTKEFITKNKEEFRAIIVAYEKVILKFINIALTFMEKYNYEYISDRLIMAIQNLVILLLRFARVDSDLNINTQLIYQPDVKVLLNLKNFLIKRNPPRFSKETHLLFEIEEYFSFLESNTPVSSV